MRARTAGLCAGARRQRLLSVPGFAYGLHPSTVGVHHCRLPGWPGRGHAIPGARPRARQQRVLVTGGPAGDRLRAGKMTGVTVVCLMQHREKEPGDPGLTGLGLTPINPRTFQLASSWLTA
jgi:hypothetical protein